MLILLKSFLQLNNKAVYILSTCRHGTHHIDATLLKKSPWEAGVHIPFSEGRHNVGPSFCMIQLQKAFGFVPAFGMFYCKFKPLTLDNSAFSGNNTLIAQTAQQTRQNIKFLCILSIFPNVLSRKSSRSAGYWFQSRNKPYQLTQPIIAN